MCYPPFLTLLEMIFPILLMTTEELLSLGQTEVPWSMCGRQRMPSSPGHRWHGQRGHRALSCSPGWQNLPDPAVLRSWPGPGGSSAQTWLQHSLGVRCNLQENPLLWRCSPLRQPSMAQLCISILPSPPDSSSSDSEAGTALPSGILCLHRQLLVLRGSRNSWWVQLSIPSPALLRALWSVLQHRVSGVCPSALQ